MSFDIERRFSCILIGLGSIGMMYDYYDDSCVLTHAQAIHQSSGFMLVAGIDSDIEKRLMFQKKFSVPSMHRLVRLMV